MNITETLVNLRDDLKKWATNNFIHISDRINSNVDFENNNPESASYINNRTHYKIPAGFMVVKDLPLTLNESTNSVSSNLILDQYQQIIYDDQIASGQESPDSEYVGSITVILDGTVYPDILVRNGSYNHRENETWVGNVDMYTDSVSESDYGTEPFVILFLDGTITLKLHPLYVTETGLEHTISLVSTSDYYSIIDEQFLPELKKIRVMQLDNNSLTSEIDTYHPLYYMWSTPEAEADEIDMVAFNRFFGIDPVNNVLKIPNLKIGGMLMEYDRENHRCVITFDKTTE